MFVMTIFYLVYLEESYVLFYKWKQCCLLHELFDLNKVLQSKWTFKLNEWLQLTFTSKIKLMCEYLFFSFQYSLVIFIIVNIVNWNNRLYKTVTLYSNNKAISSTLQFKRLDKSYLVCKVNFKLHQKLFTSTGNYYVAFIVYIISLQWWVFINIMLNMSFVKLLFIGCFVSVHSLGWVNNKLK